MHKHTRINKFLLLLGIAVLSTMVLTGCGKQKINLNKYVSLAAEGYDGYGRAVVNVDYDLLNKDFAGKLEAAEGMDNIAMLSGGSKVEFLFDNYVDYSLDKSSDLSNGDTVTLTFDCKDAEALDYFNIELKRDDITLKVKDLPAVTEFDPFEYVSLTCEGIDTFGSATIDTASSPNNETDYISFYSNDSMYNLTNGDKITILAEAYDNLASECGVVLSADSKEFTVSGLTEPKDLDPFADLSLTFSGISGIGKADMKYSGSYSFIDSYSFSVDKAYNLTNGDKVKATVYVDDEYALSEGYRISTTEKEYTVSGLTEPTPLDPFEDLELTYDGYSGIGSVTSYEYFGDYDFISAYSFSADKTNNLSNGDTITVTASINADSALQKGYVIESTTQEFSVEGLTEPTAWSPFDCIDVSFVGPAPYGSLEYTFEDETGLVRSDDYIFDNTRFLSNGDKITCSVTVDDDYALRQGLTVSETTKEYTVEGMDEFVKSFDSIDEDFLETIKSSATDVIEAYANDNTCGISSIDDLTYEGYIFKTIKDEYVQSEVSYDYNYLYLIFKGTTSGDNEAVDGTTLYLPVMFANGVLYSNGECVYNPCNIAGLATLGRTGYVLGYNDPGICYADLMTIGSAKYNIECGGIEDYEDDSYTTLYSGENLDGVIFVPTIAGNSVTVEESGSNEMTVDGCKVDKVSDSIAAEGQVNTYMFAPDNNGTHTIRLSNMMEGFKVWVGVYNDKGEKVRGDYFRNKCLVLNDLEAGSTYTISVEQYSGTGTYDMEVLYAKPEIDISGYTTLSDSIEFDGQYNTYKFTAPISGQYRFAVDNMISDFRVSLSIYNSFNEKVKLDYCSSGRGINVYLDEGEEYTLYAGQYSSVYGEYTFYAFYPHEALDVTDVTEIHDYIEFDDQCNHYTFTAPVSGTYSFSTSDMVSDFAIFCEVYDNLQARLQYDTLRNNNRSSVSLTGGETYDIYISQYSNAGSYTLNIGYAKPVLDISGGVTVVDNMEFGGQVNEYRFVPTDNRAAYIYIDGMTEDMQIGFKMVDADGYTKVSYGYCSSGNSFDTDDLTAGEEYTVYVSQQDSLGQYAVTIL